MVRGLNVERDVCPVWLMRDEARAWSLRTKWRRWGNLSLGTRRHPLITPLCHDFLSCAFEYVNKYLIEDSF